jgi:hypothetical protein
MSLFQKHQANKAEKYLLGTILLTSTLIGLLAYSRFFEKLSKSDRFIQTLYSSSREDTFFGCGNFNENTLNSYYRNLQKYEYGGFFLQYKTHQSNVWEDLIIRSEEPRFIEPMMRMNPSQDAYTKTLLTMNHLQEIEDHALSENQIALSQWVIDFLSIDTESTSFRLNANNIKNEQDEFVAFEYPVELKYTFENDYGLIQNQTSLLNPYPKAVMGYNPMIKSLLPTVSNENEDMVGAFYNALNPPNGVTVSCTTTGLTFGLRRTIERHYSVILSDSVIILMGFLIGMAILQLLFLLEDFDDYVVYEYRSKLSFLSMFYLHSKINGHSFALAMTFPWVLATLGLIIERLVTLIWAPFAFYVLTASYISYFSIIGVFLGGWIMLNILSFLVFKAIKKIIT